MEGFNIDLPKAGFAATGGGQPLVDAPETSLPAMAKGFDLYSWDLEKSKDSSLFWILACREQ